MKLGHMGMVALLRIARFAAIDKERVVDVALRTQVVWKGRWSP
jgi:hypothetical protein